jgi:hypothetical protein
MVMVMPPSVRDYDAGRDAASDRRSTRGRSGYGSRSGADAGVWQAVGQVHPTPHSSWIAGYLLGEGLEIEIIFQKIVSV